MRGRGLRARQKHRFRPRTTDSHHLCPIAPNRLAQRTAPPQAPNEVWVADIPCIATAEGWLHLAGVLDLCTRKLVGSGGRGHDGHRPGGRRPRARPHPPAPRPGPAAPLRPRQPVCQRRLPPAFTPKWDASEHQPGRATAIDNAAMESFWATLKTELIGGRVFDTRTQARTGVFDDVKCFYNRARLHGALGFQTPVEYERNPG